MPDPPHPQGHPERSRGGLGTTLRSRLSSLRLSPAREHEIVEELSQHLEDRWRELVSGGASEDEATRLALAEFREGNLLARYMAPLRQAQAPAAITPGARPDTAPRCRARPAVCDANVEAATRLQPHGYPDARPGDWRDDGHVQRGQRSRDQAPSLSRIRKRRDGWRFGSIWKPAYARLPAGASDVRFVRGERPIVPGVRSVHWVRGDGDRVGESGTHEHVAGDARDPDGPGRSTLAGPMVSPDDHRPGTQDTAILSNGYWQRRFGGDPAVIGA